jgi:para-aminobenzoate synthetase component 1
MNRLGRQKIPFVFMLDAWADRGLVVPVEESHQWLLYDLNGKANCQPQPNTPPLAKWDVFPVDYPVYEKGFNLVMDHIRRGDSFLLNYTQPTRIETNLSLSELFHVAKARYKVHLKGSFTCFSPEIFVTIDERGKISSHPMKGTLPVTEQDAENHILHDRKEIAEHHTIVDLIRNDLSKVALQVKVDKFRYLDRIETNRLPLLQVSSGISGILPPDWHEMLGDIFMELLPAGSVTGAPKHMTMEIIKRAEGYDRNWYTGVFGIFDGTTVDSGVLIRYVEETDGDLYFKSGGGITYQSHCKAEYEEMISKVYVPVA